MVDILKYHGLSILVPHSLQNSELNGIDAPQLGQNIFWNGTGG